MLDYQYNPELLIGKFMHFTVTNDFLTNYIKTL